MCEKTLPVIAMDISTSALRMRSGERKLATVGAHLEERKQASYGIRQCKYKLIRTGNSASVEIIKCTNGIELEQAAYHLRVILFVRSSLLWFAAR